MIPIFKPYNQSISAGRKLIVPKALPTVHALLDYIRETFQENIFQWSLLVDHTGQPLKLSDSTVPLFDQYTGTEDKLSLKPHPLIQYVEKKNSVSS